MGPIRLVEFTKAFYIGGTEVQVLELLRGLSSRHELSVAVLDEVGPLLEQVWKEGHLPTAFPVGRSMISPRGVMQVGRLAWWLKSRNVDLVHAHDFYSTLLAVPACLAVGIPVVVGRLDLLHWHGAARARALAAMTRRADHVIANAEAIRRHLVEVEHIPPQRVTVIRNGIDLRRFDRRIDQGLQEPLPEVEGLPVVAHVANMSHSVKRQEDLLRALQLLLARAGPVHVFLVGDGYRRAQLQALAVELGVEKYAHFLGFRQDVPAILARANVGVLCSSHEGLSNAIIEGMASGLPMVVTHVGGNAELVAHGERGLVVPPLRPDALAAAIERLILDAPEARRMGQCGRKFVEDQLSLDRMIDLHDALYRKVAGRPRGEALAPEVVSV